MSEKYNKDRVDHLFRLRKENNLHWSFIPTFVILIVLVFAGGTLWWVPLTAGFVLIVVAAQHHNNKITKEIEKELSIQ